VSFVAECEQCGVIERVESVGAVGRVSTSVYVQLQGCQEQTNAKPEGDDTWRKYHRGETA